MCGLLVMDLWFLMVYRVSVLLSLKMKILSRRIIDLFSFEYYKLA